MRYISGNGPHGYTYALSLLSRYTASANVVAAQTIKATVIEFPTKNLGAYVVLYDINGIHALKAYLCQSISETVIILDWPRVSYAIELVEPRMIILSRLSPAQTSLTIV